MSEQRIGSDQWVEQYGERRSQPADLRSRFFELGERLPLLGRLGLLVLLGVAVPLLSSNSSHIRIAGTVALMATLALGLNIVVGYAGLLDLGFVAFYGLGAYAYAYLSSDFIEGGVHLPSPLSIVIIVLLSAFFGLLLGLPSLRLVGDYLAIVTLAFGQIFVELTSGLTRVGLPGRDRPVDLTGGPNGILRLDSLSLAGLSADTLVQKYYVLIVVLALVLLVVYHLNESRLGRAWRSLREDELAAEAMGMPTRKLKLMAFALGAAIAGLSGALFASWQGAVFPNNFAVQVLITLYAIIVLGGLGSLTGVIGGAIVMIAGPEILRDADLASNVFYAGAVIALFATLRPRWQVPGLLIALAIFGLIVGEVASSISPETFPVLDESGSVFITAIRDWLAIPESPRIPGNWAFTGAVALILVVSRIKHVWLRFGVLVPTLYLLIFAWETRLAVEDSVTRLILIGLMLVVLMIYRPQGLFGERRVTVV